MTNQINIKLTNSAEEVTTSKMYAMTQYLKSEGFSNDELEDLIQSSHDENVFELGNKEYLILTDEEADERAKASILDLVWAFRPYFLADQTGMSVKVFEALAKSELCEDTNEAVLACIKDKESFVKAAIEADGRGHFINSYDGQEYEQGEYYIYRIN